MAASWKYRRWPSYHTRAAKTCWFLIAVAAVCLFAGWAVWPLRVAAIAPGTVLPPEDFSAEDVRTLAERAPLEGTMTLLPWKLIRYEFEFPGDDAE